MASHTQRETEAGEVLRERGGESERKRLFQAVVTDGITVSPHVKFHICYSALQFTVYQLFGESTNHNQHMFLKQT